MIKVLELGITGTTGGIETYLFSQYQHMDRQTVHCDYINDKQYQKLAFEEEFKRMGAGIVVMQTNFSRHPFRFMNEFSAMLIGNQYDVVIANATLYSLKQACELSLAKKAGIPVRVFHSHTAGGKKNLKTFFGWLFEHFKCAYGKGQVITHRWACSEAAGTYFFGKQPFEVINNGIDVKRFSFDETKRKRSREQMQVPENRIVLGNVGRINYPKNQSFLIPVLKACLEQGMNAELWLVGAMHPEDEEPKKVKEAIIQDNVQDRVRLLGQRTDVPDLLMAMDVFLLPSLFEGFGTVCIEAESTGIPCVFSDTIPHSVGIVKKNVFESLKDSPNQWAETIAGLLATPLERKDDWKTVEDAGFGIASNAKRVEKLLFNYVGN